MKVAIFTILATALATAADAEGVSTFTLTSDDSNMDYSTAEDLVLSESVELTFAFSTGSSSGRLLQLQVKELQTELQQHVVLDLQLGRVVALVNPEQAPQRHYFAQEVADDRSHPVKLHLNTSHLSVYLDEAMHTFSIPHESDIIHVFPAFGAQHVSIGSTMLSVCAIQRILKVPSATKAPSLATSSTANEGYLLLSLSVLKLGNIDAPAHVDVFLRRDGLDLLRTEERTEKVGFNVALDELWHRLTFKIFNSEKKLHVQYDGEEEHSIPLPDYFHGFNSVQIGGSKTDGAATGRPYTGCLKSIFVDQDSLLLELRNGSSSVVFREGPPEFHCPKVLEPAPMGDPVQVFVQEAPKTTTSTEAPEPTGAPPIFSTVWQSCEILNCQHNTVCVKHGHNDYRCNCDGTGYSGRQCQFRDLAHNCAQLYRRGYRTSGIYQVDPDDSDTVPPALVTCNFGSSEQGTETLVDSNLIPGTVVRSPNLDDTVFQLKYRNFDSNGLLALKGSTGHNCTQALKYTCEEAPLEFPYMTSFKSVSTAERFGSFLDQGHQCSCAIEKQCHAGKPCNCDANSQSELSDNGYYVGDRAGVSEVLALQTKGGGEGKLTLGPLQCHGTASSGPITIRKPNASLTVDRKWAGRQVSFYFRTAREDPHLLTLEEDNGNRVHLRVHSGHILEASISSTTDRVVHRLEVTSQGSVSEGQWHYVSLEFHLDEAFLRLDTYTASARCRLNRVAPWDGVVTIGGVDPSDRGANSFTGCIEGLMLDNEMLDLANMLESKPTDGIVGGCASHCEGVNCRNGGVCVEDYANSRFYCKCSNRFAYSGQYCEMDLNIGHEVMVKGREAYLEIKDTSQGNPVTDNLLISYKASSPGLILYAVDELYNFVEVILETPNTLTLVLNNDALVTSCKINRTDRADFASNQWVQIAIEYREDKVVFHADDLACSIPGKRVISDKFMTVKNYQNFELSHVIPSRAPVTPSEKPNPYSIIFVGGVNLADPHKPLFAMTQASLLTGCFRGFRLKDKRVDLEDGEFSNNYGVVKGCIDGCDVLSCHNGGFCDPQLKEYGKFDPKCDCYKTSYQGQQCDEDIGITTSQRVVLHAGNLRLAQLGDKEPSRLAFAFSTPPQMLVSPPQLLVAIAAYDDSPQSHVQVHLVKHNEIRVYAGGDLFTFEPHNFNYTDGHRHFVRIEVYHDVLNILIDQQLQQHTYSDASKELMLYRARLLFVNGFPDLGTEFCSDFCQTNHGAVTKFEGCISNVMLSIGKEVVRPINSLVDTRSKQHSFVHLIDGDSLTPGKCALFAPPSVKESVPAPFAAFAPWPEYGKLIADHYTRPLTPGRPVVLQTTPGPKKGLDGGVIAGIILGLIFIIVAILTCIYIVYLRYRKRQPLAESPEEKRRWPEESQPFTKSDIPPPPSGGVARGPLYQPANPPETRLAETEDMRDLETHKRDSYYNGYSNGAAIYENVRPANVPPPLYSPFPVHISDLK